MGLSSLTLLIIALFGGFFLISFFLSSRAIDSKGVLEWMLQNPDDWIGNKNKK